MGHSSEGFLCTKAPPAAGSRPATLHRGHFPNLGAEHDFAAAVPGCGGWAVSGWELGGLRPVLPRAGMKPTFTGWDLQVSEQWGRAGQGASQKGCAMGVGSAGSGAQKMYQHSWMRYRCNSPEFYLIDSCWNTTFSLVQLQEVLGLVFC